MRGVHRFKNVETQQTVASTRQTTVADLKTPVDSKFAGDLSNFIDCDDDEEDDQIGQKNYNLADIDTNNY